MITRFDYYNRFEIPNLILCNPSKQKLASLDLSYDRVLKIRYNDLSEFTFSLPERIDSIEFIEAYNLLEVKRLVYVQDIGYFLIVDIENSYNGSVPIKKVICQSLEAELNYKRVAGLKGTFLFYNPVSPSGTLLKRLIDMIPNWSIGSVDSSLLTKSRTFNVTDGTLYGFLMGEVESAFECIFTFDIVNRRINALARENATLPTDIYLSFDNLIESLNIKTLSNEIVTSLYVYGGGNLDIRTVNPLGTNNIYNFDYYTNTNWMSQDTIDAVNNWKTLVNFNQPVYADLLTNLKNFNILLLQHQSELSALQTEYNSLEGVMKVRIEQGLDIVDVKSQMDAKSLQINSKNLEIQADNNNITTTTNSLRNINANLSFSTNFTANQYAEILPFIIENSYQNSNFIQTDLMNPDEIQDMSQLLYNQSQSVLSRVSQPRYEFSMDSVNFLALKEFQEFSDQLELGSNIKIEVNDNYKITATLLEISINYDSPSDFSLTFSNRLRLVDSAFTTSDLFGQAISSGASVNLNKELWNNFDTNYKNEVTEFIDSSLDASKNSVISSSDQEILINQNGLQGKKKIETGYDPKQVWLTSNMLAFTKDNWNTASIALGESPNGQWGLVADYIVGRLVAGQQLTIQNENNTFEVNSTGANLVNANLSITKSDNKNRILLDPSNGIKIQGFENGFWEDKFFADANGNINITGIVNATSGSFTGSITTNSGLIGGWTINSNGISDSFGNYIRSNGQIKLGALTINGSNSSFNGTVSADQFIDGSINGSKLTSGTVGSDKISYLDAGKINTGFMSGNRIYGGIITWPGGRIGTTGTGAPEIYGNGTITMQSSNGGFVGVGSTAFLYGPNGVTIQGSDISLRGNLYTDGISTYTGTFSVGPSYANKSINVRNGLITSWSYI